MRLLARRQWLPVHNVGLEGFVRAVHGTEATLHRIRRHAQTQGTIRMRLQRELPIGALQAIRLQIQEEVRRDRNLRTEQHVTGICDLDVFHVVLFLRVAPPQRIPQVCQKRAALSSRRI